MQDNDGEIDVAFLLDWSLPLKEKCRYLSAFEIPSSNWESIRFPILYYRFAWYSFVFDFQTQTYFEEKIFWTWTKHVRGSNMQTWNNDQNWTVLDN